MSIVVIDMSPELFWYVSNSLGEIDMPLKHVPDSKQALALIQKELPKIVILNHDDPNLNVADLIGKMRNHVFARNTLFLVFSSNYSLESRRQLVIQGAAQVFYRLGNTYPKPKVFSNTIHWLLNLKNKENKFEFEYVPMESEAQIVTWGRIGQITSSEFVIESNLDISPGDTINISSPIFDDLQIKGAQFVCTEKNTIGRYYQYANSFKGRIVTKHNDQDLKKIQSWVIANATISKNKPVKIVYFEADPNQRDVITQMIKMDKKYCARGYSELEDFDKILEYQKPNLILINRNLIQKYKTQFEAIKKFIKNNFCYCVTYAIDEVTDVQEFKKNYDFAVHSSANIDLKLLESMISKLEAKMPSEGSIKKVIPNKHSPYSRIAFHFEGKINQISKGSITFKTNVAVANYCSLQIEASKFVSIGLSHQQLFRVIGTKVNNQTREYLHQLLFIGPTQKELENIELFEKTEKEKLKA